MVSAREGLWAPEIESTTRGFKARCLGVDASSVTLDGVTEERGTSGRDKRHG